MKFPSAYVIWTTCLCASITACDAPSGEVPPAMAISAATHVEATAPASAPRPHVDSRTDGHYFVRRDLGRVPRVFTEKSRATGEDVRGVLNDVASEFRMRGEDLVFRKQNVDEQGHRHLRFQQFHGGLPVIGSALVLHVDSQGAVYAVNGNARGGGRVSREGVIPPENAAQVAVRGSRAEPAMAVGSPKQVFLRPEGDEEMHLAWQVQVEGQRAGIPSKDLVYVDANDGELLAVHPRIHSALNRRIYNGNNASTLPGTLVRGEGQAEHPDPVVNTNYDHLGTVYDCYSELFGRDSIDNAGAALLSTVHHRVAYVNAFWDGTQLVYGDGDGVNASNLANSLDLTAHELTHAVTDHESELIYSGESGGLNESLSDIFGAVCEWYGDGKVVSPHTWEIGDGIWTPHIPNDALRYMANPTQDGDSLDCYSDYSSGVDVHYSSGISNLAFYLLSQGGTHPRAKTTTVVAGIGIEKAANIFYKANRDILIASSNFEAAKTATEQAAAQLGYDAATITSVSNAWKAVCIGVEVEGPGPTPWLSMTGLSGSAGSFQHWSLDVPAGRSKVTFKVSGGTGDVDLYARFGAPPTTTTYHCRPNLSGNNETCTFTLPQAGRYHVSLYGRSVFSGVNLTGTFDDPPLCPPWRWPWPWPIPVVPPPPPPPPWDPIINIADSIVGHFNYWTVDVPSGQSAVTFALSGGTGDADLYVNFGTAPTTTAYQCRPYLGGNTETCTLTAPTAGTYFVGLRVYSAYSGVTLTTWTGLGHSE
ncbi:M4 family metallopeptidase [Myxococcus sp. CA051A]|uniref:M4 family metallopeptidase n=1 Tax=Myxococcus sp. CA051A TaxID=2741739 RepID=UPI00157B3163|nr:M4 family metallopeptidase [Myxococcus sp. CA051A]NTX59998.1 M4 family metallopeptidase [Myxococcus sp. CA051A]